MNIYLTIIGGWIIGQITLTVIASYILQLKKQNVDYLQAIGVYFKAEKGNYAIAVCALAIVLFALSDYIDPHIDRKILIAKLVSKDALTWQEKIIMYARTYSVAFGLFCSFVMLVVFRKGIKAISDYNVKNGLQDDTKNDAA